jgi:calcineurin-like phosphoesterase family protein
MRTFFTSDLHFGHQNIIEYCRRPFASVQEMNAGLVELWNAVVGPEDEVWVLGDVCLGNIEDSLRYVGKLQGTKHLIAGNHDRVFREGRRDEWEGRYKDAGFVSITYGHRLLSTEQPILLSHFPYEGDSRMEDRFTDQRPPDAGLPLLHGHVHGRWRKKGRIIDVGVDAWGGQPVDLPTLLDLLDSGDDFVERLQWT